LISNYLERDGTLYQKTTLKNGLRVLTSYMPQTHSVCIALFIGVGSRYESAVEAGTCHFIEHVCFRGTPTRPTSRDISEAIEGVGGILNGATDKEMTFYWCKVTRDHFPAATSVLADMLLNSKFDPADIEKERQVIIEEIHMCKDSPSQQVGMIIDELLWPGHALGRDIAGSKETVSSIDRAALLSFMNLNYTPQNTLIAITGNIEKDAAIETVEKELGGWSNPAPRPLYSTFKEDPGPRLKIEKRDTEQAHLCLAMPGISLVHPQRFHLDLLNVILGEGMSSRLFAEIRDKMGLAYGISSYVEHFLDSGSLTVAASVDPSNLNKTVKAVLEQLHLLREEIPEAEIRKAREISKGRMMLRMEDSRNVAGWLGGQEMLTGYIQTLEEVVAIIDSIQMSDLQRIARDLIVDEKIRLAVVGPVKSANMLKKMLKIETE
jgi:predicted Zn-dependent peptidase